MNKTSMKIGVIGCGMISDWYFKAARRFKQMNIICCGDLREESAIKEQCSAKEESDDPHRSSDSCD